MFDLCVITDQVSMDLEYSLQYLQDLGVEWIEIHALWDKNIEELNEKEVEKAVSLVEKYGMRVSNISGTLFLCCPLSKTERKEYEPIDDYFITVQGDYTEHLEMHKRCLDLCKKFKTDKLRVFGFIEEQTDMNEDEMIATVAELFSEPVAMAEKEGITVLCENCPHTYLNKGYLVQKVIEKLGSPNLQALWDPGNTVRAGGTPFPDDYNTVKKSIGHIHLKDLTSEGKMVPLGEGVLEYDKILGQLIKDGYPGTASLEPEYVAKKGGRPEGLRRAYESITRIIGSL